MIQVTNQGSQDVDVLGPVPDIVADVLVCVQQASGIQSRSLRTETRNLEIQDGEDVHVLRRPVTSMSHDDVTNITVTSC